MIANADPPKTRKIDHDAINALAIQYRDTRDEVVFLKLIEAMDFRIRYLVKINRKRSDVLLDDDEAMNCARMGVHQAAMEFDETREVSFLTFSNQRISGEIIDQCRVADPLPRYVRQAKSIVDNDVREWEAETGDIGWCPRDAISECARHWLDDIKRIHESIPLSTLPSRAFPEDECSDSHIRLIIMDLCVELPKRNRMILADYFSGDNMRAIGLRYSGTHLNRSTLSESRVSQIIKEGLAHLRERFAGRDPNDVI